MTARRAMRPRLHHGWWRLVEAFLIMAFGGTLLGIVGSGHHLRYVRPEMALPLILTGLCLVGLALWTVLVTCRRSSVRSAHADHDDHGDHGGHGASWSVWLIMVPVVIAAVLTPSALGSDLAQRRGPAAVTTTELPPLPGVPPAAAGSAGKPLGLPMGKYAALAVGSDEEALTGRRFTITGFVINRPEDEGWDLARIRIQCCAADAVAVLVRIVDPPPRQDDEWVEVTGSYLPPVQDGSGPVARLEADEVRTIEEPDQPYVFE